MVYFIIKDDVSEVFDCVLLRRTDAEEPLIDDEAREDEYQRADEAQDDYYKKPDQDQLLSAPHVWNLNVFVSYTDWRHLILKFFDFYLKDFILFKLKN